MNHTRAAWRERTPQNRPRVVTVDNEGNRREIKRSELRAVPLTEYTVSEVLAWLDFREQERSAGRGTA